MIDIELAQRPGNPDHVENEDEQLLASQQRTRCICLVPSYFKEMKATSKPAHDSKLSWLRSQTSHNDFDISLRYFNLHTELQSLQKHPRKFPYNQYIGSAGSVNDLWRDRDRRHAVQKSSLEPCDVSPEATTISPSSMSSSSGSPRELDASPCCRFFSCNRDVVTVETVFAIDIGESKLPAQLATQLLTLWVSSSATSSFGTNASPRAELARRFNDQRERRAIGQTWPPKERLCQTTNSCAKPHKPIHNPCRKTRTRANRV